MKTKFIIKNHEESITRCGSWTSKGLHSPKITETLALKGVFE
jgi:hypothetical protein